MEGVGIFILTLQRRGGGEGGWRERKEGERHSLPWGFSTSGTSAEKAVFSFCSNSGQTLSPQLHYNLGIFTIRDFPALAYGPLISKNM